MEHKISSPKAGAISPPNCDSDPEEKEISDDDDDDRNHKHRRRETSSQSLERDQAEKTSTQPYRKRNRAFENGQRDPQSHFNSDRDFPKFDKRRGSFYQGPGRGRGRDYLRDPRFGSVDAASQMSHSNAMFHGRGLPNVSNAQNGSWNGFGLMPPIPNGPIDTINPLGLPGVLRPPLNSSLGIQRQRCRDFEERGFCLRGDICPMEHGVNRIVIEDVQSLSQFNLPVSLSNAHMMGTTSGSGFVPSVGGSSGVLVNNRGVHNRPNKSADDDALGVDGAFSGAVNSSGADVYDPDQPLWNNNSHEASTPLLGLQPPNYDESESLLDGDHSERLIRSSGASVVSQSTSATVWGRLNGSKNKFEVKDKSDYRIKPSEYTEIKLKESGDVSGGSHANPHAGKQSNGAAFGQKAFGSTSKQNDVRKTTQKAQRTLFVNCIPPKDNKKENLLAHFKKFGEVIDIYIPANTERAFVQFSKREEAERALKAPDAVMGSRFIKLWWANRDSVADDAMNSGYNFSIPPRDVPATSVSPHPAVISKGKDNVQKVVPSAFEFKNPDSVGIGSDSKPTSGIGPKAPPPVQKRESLELLKEELRRKQEMLEQKQNEFRRQLEKKLSRTSQVTEVTTEAPTGQAAKKQKVETSAVASKASSASSLPAGVLVDKVENVETDASQRSKTSSVAAPPDPQSMKLALRPVTSSGSPFYVNRYKLDNRPKAIRISAPLPASLSNVDALRDHFSVFGEIANVEIEELGLEAGQHALNGSEEMRNCSARVTFVTRHSAEKAFLNGKVWHGHQMQFTWVTPNIPSSSRSSGESTSALRGTLNTEVQSADKTAPDNSPPTETNSSPQKSFNEVQCESSRLGDRGTSPIADSERLVLEAQLLDKAANYIPLEAEDPEDKDSEEQEENVGDEMQPRNDMEAEAGPLPT